MIKRIIILLYFIFSISNLIGQEYEFRGYLGASYYQGDLAPTTNRFSFSKGQISWATMLGIKLNDVFKLNVKYMTGKLVGDDSDSKDASRKLRNLNFESPLHELGVNTEININHFLPFLNKYGLNVYYTSGVNLFYFNPKTFLRNEFGMLEIIELQQQGTEGQGLPGFEEKYDLTQINIPFGLGFKFHLFDNIEMGVELTPRFTFTDYIDDVSGNYVSYDRLVAADRKIAAMLANRTGEYLGTEHVEVPEGTRRGNPNNNDWYFFTGVYLSYNWGAGYAPLKGVTNPLEEDEIEEDLISNQ